MRALTAASSLVALVRARNALAPGLLGLPIVKPVGTPTLKVTVQSANSHELGPPGCITDIGSACLTCIPANPFSGCMFK
ncbi:hypothetical protein GcM1_06761 [Golovinomyces cichoracearum]|uniref:Effector protein n=1 Tax=Golovinomyces cichoracearum TaxID=62708 RepID=A0A420JC51_9PEZI|nr:hypothetical protein GcM1_06761 [Golovinomyces cichoracearum]